MSPLPVAPGAARRRVRRLPAAVVWGGAGLLSLLLQGCSRPPGDAIAGAERALKQAAEASGALGAPEACAEARDALLKAQAEVAVQGRRLILSRDYRQAEAMAALALRESQGCAARARSRRDLARDRAERAMRDLEEWIGRALSLARHLPGDGETKRGLLEAEIILGEARASFDRQQYARAGESASRGRGHLARVVADFSAAIDRFRRSPRLPAWRRWVEDTVRESRRGGEAVIVVDKLRRQLLLLRGDEEIASFPVDLGAGGIESKTRSGDDATPEGRYRITEVRGPGQTRYYRALMLDYPNADDRARFRKLKRAGRLVAGQTIGGLIEIHGRGGRGTDWTQGCVALDNDDMDDLVPRVGVGTRVTIVGTVPDGAIP